MFPVITDIYKKTKGRALMELFTATGKLKRSFFDNCRCSMCAPCVTRHTLTRNSSSCYKRVTMVTRVCRLGVYSQSAHDTATNTE